MPFVIPAVVAVPTSGIPGGDADLAADPDLDHGALGLHAGGADHGALSPMARIADMIRIKRAAKLAVLGAIEPSKLDHDDEDDDL